MSFHQTLALTLLISLSLGFASVSSFADERDARLTHRISELEAENRALRKIIAGIQSSLKALPDQKVAGNDASNRLRIIVLPGEWGESSLVDIAKVCQSAAGTILSQLPDDGFAPIILQKDNSGPITLYRRGEGNEHIVRLNTGDRAWAQLAFQFAHEFCHIVCNYRDAKNQQLWFEETLCECASLYSLRRMAIQWKTNPPYSNWKDYSSSLANYAQDRLNKSDGQNQSLAQFYRSNVEELEKDGTNRKMNDFIAAKLLPLFEGTPDAFKTLRYINLGPAEENTSFKNYLSGWRDRVPAEHGSFVDRVANAFEVELSKAKSPQ